MPEIEIIASRPLPTVHRSAFVWQPVRDHDGVQMRLAPIDWMPSGAHECIQMLVDDMAAADSDFARALVAAQGRIAELEEIVWRLVHLMEADQPTDDDWDEAIADARALVGARS